VQGLTIKDAFAIHGYENIYDWDRSILYTAITRGIDISRIKLYKYEAILPYAPFVHPLQINKKDILEADD
jgi:hypothetical protein